LPRILTWHGAPKAPCGFVGLTRLSRGRQNLSQAEGGRFPIAGLQGLNQTLGFANQIAAPCDGFQFLGIPHHNIRCGHNHKAGSRRNP
jgi:hypothetical protein